MGVEKKIASRFTIKKQGKTTVYRVRKSREEKTGETKKRGRKEKEIKIWIRFEEKSVRIRKEKVGIKE